MSLVQRSVVFALCVVTVEPCIRAAATGWEPPAAGAGRAGYRSGMFASWQRCARRKEGQGQVCVGAPEKRARCQRTRGILHGRRRCRCPDLDNPKDAGMTDSMLGRWVEIGGILEKETSKNPDNLRELDVKSFKAVPVVVPRAAAAPTTPPRAAAAAAPASPPVPSTSPAPAATTASAAPAQAGQSLPHTASNRPAIGLVALLALAVAFILRSFRLRQQG